jgi:LacI family transcriptional regulator, repressor for deo operon, udp, cdd, tsx, nupC, and nupG
MNTITDVARRAAVSTATVSRVLSQPGIVSPATRERVLRAVADLGYEPNPAARALRTLRAQKLLVTLPDISNPFFAHVIRGAEEAARDAGYAVILGDTRHDPELENQYAAMLRRREVDGLLFLGHRLPESLSSAVAKTPGLTPVVNGCEYSPELGVSSVHIDNAVAGEEAMRHLIDLGHTRIGVITGPLISPISRDRLDGVHRAAAAAPATRLNVRHGDFSVEAGFNQAANLLAEGVTALFCFSDEMAIGAMNAVRSRGLACPADVSIVGFDDIRFANYLQPALTTIAQPMSEIGRRCVDLLIKIIVGDLTKPAIVTLPHRLVVRGSTGPAT